MVLKTVLATTLLAALPVATEAGEMNGVKGVEITSITGSVAPLRSYFNDNRGKKRFVTLLSPT